MEIFLSNSSSVLLSGVDEGGHVSVRGDEHGDTDVNEIEHIFVDLRKEPLPRDVDLRKVSRTSGVELLSPEVGECGRKTELRPVSEIMERTKGVVDSLSKDDGLERIGGTSYDCTDDPYGVVEEFELRRESPELFERDGILDFLTARQSGLARRSRHAERYDVHLLHDDPLLFRRESFQVGILVARRLARVVLLTHLLVAR